MFDEFGINAGFVEDLHAKFRQSPQAVDPDWRAFFEAVEQGRPAYAPGSGVSIVPAAPRSGQGGNGNGNGNGTANGNGHGAYEAGEAASPDRSATRNREKVIAVAEGQSRVAQLVNAYRVRGHLFARVNPLGAPPSAAPELDLALFGLEEKDLEHTFATGGIGGLPERATLRTIVSHLEETYCGSIGVEYTHLEDIETREWLQGAMESTKNRYAIQRSEALRVLTRLTDAEIFESFVHRNFVGAKRFSLEGAESMIPMLDLLIDHSAEHGVEEIVIGMAHRGRLNVLVNVLDKNLRELFAAFSDRNPERFLGAGDVKYHLGQSTDRETPSGKKVHLTLAFNPSHLEFVNPVVEGRVRAKQDRKGHRNVMPLLIHGDAAFMGQGIVPETLNLAGLEGYATGGTVHLVVNNQVGFTTLPEDSRSTRYCTDITRMMRCPVFHVNGEDPEAVVQVTRLAIEYRQRTGMDVVIDMYCYRRYGHNEGDEPRFTQPTMYSVIDQKPTVREMYVARLVASGDVTKAKADEIEAARRAALSEALEDEKKGDYLKPPPAMGGLWASYLGGPEAKVPEVATAVDRQVLNGLVQKLCTLPDGFTANPKVLKVLEQRRDKVLAGQPFDWGTAEHLAFATLVQEGRRVRLSGQDARRGTFTHRHSALHDAKTGQRYVPLANLGTGIFDVFDSSLSEAGVLGFEYGYSLDSPDGLVIWEAQFGDFVNGAQVIVDQFLVSAEDKWSRLSGLVLLLPHGYEGQGPEHSSARIERFLQMSAEDNIQVCNLTTPAQIFHALRRQVLRPWRKPLVIFTPKSLLRKPEATSTVDDLATGSFQRIIGDAHADPKKVKRVLLCSGKVYYDLADAREKTKRTDVAILRVEQLYPLNGALDKAVDVYAKDAEVVWVQEEPRNAGPWYFMLDHLPAHLGGRALSVAAREASASPATGSQASHKLEQERLVAEALGKG